MTTIRVYVSAPNDAIEELSLAGCVLARLQLEFRGRLELVPVLQEHQPLLGSPRWRDEFCSPAQMDVVVLILKSRLGTRLPHPLPPGSPEPEETTTLELAEAARGFRGRGGPRTLIFRWTGRATSTTTSHREAQEWIARLEALQRFFAELADRPLEPMGASLHEFSGFEQFEQTLERSLRERLNELARRRGATGAVEPAEEKPFRGLAEFSEQDRPQFLGRTRMVERVLTALKRQARDRRPFVLIAGDHQSGKTSLIRAGVIPALSHPGAVDSIAQWRIAHLRFDWASHSPFRLLAAALLGPTGLPEIGTDHDVKSLKRLFEDDAEGSAQLIERTVADIEAELGDLDWTVGKVGVRLLLVLDQLEGLVERERLPEKRIERFWGLIERLVRTGHVWCIAAVRTEGYPALSHSPTFLALKENGHLDLAPPDEDELRRIVEGKLRLAGVKADPRYPAEALIRAARRKRLNLAQLQVYLTLAWNARQGAVLGLPKHHPDGDIEGLEADYCRAAVGAASPEALTQLGMSFAVATPVGGRVWRRAAAIRQEVGDPALLDRLLAAGLIEESVDADGQPCLGPARHGVLTRWREIERVMGEFGHAKEEARVRPSLEDSTPPLGRSAASLAAPQPVQADSSPELDVSVAGESSGDFTLISSEDDLPGVAKPDVIRARSPLAAWLNPTRVFLAALSLLAISVVSVAVIQFLNPPRLPERPGRASGELAAAANDESGGGADADSTRDSANAAPAVVRGVSSPVSAAEPAKAGSETPKEAARSEAPTPENSSAATRPAESGPVDLNRAVLRELGVPLDESVELNEARLVSGVLTLKGFAPSISTRIEMRSKLMNGRAQIESAAGLEAGSITDVDVVGMRIRFSKPAKKKSN